MGVVFSFAHDRKFKGVRLRSEGRGPGRAGPREIFISFAKSKSTDSRKKIWLVKDGSSAVVGIPFESGVVSLLDGRGYVTRNA